MNQFPNGDEKKIKYYAVHYFVAPGKSIDNCYGFGMKLVATTKSSYGGWKLHKSDLEEELMDIFKSRSFEVIFSHAGKISENSFKNQKNYLQLTQQYLQEFYKGNL